MDPQTGDRKWEFRMDAVAFRVGVLTTASDLLFAGASGLGPTHLVNGNFYALDARSGNLLWRMALPGSVESGPMSYAVGGKQYVAVAAGNTLFAFALRQ